MSGMFSRSHSFNQPLDSWDVSSVTDMNWMFALASSFNQPLDSWDVSSVADTSYMFNGASSFNHHIAPWNVSSATDMSNMFNGSPSFNQNLGHWYIILDDSAIHDGDPTRVVGNILTQNPYLAGQDLIYGIGSGWDSDHFEIDGAVLKLRTIPDISAKSFYTVNITSAGGFGPGNFRTFDITVEQDPDASPTS